MDYKASIKPPNINLSLISFSKIQNSKILSEASAELGVSIQHLSNYFKILGFKVYSSLKKMDITTIKEQLSSKGYDYNACIKYTTNINSIKFCVVHEIICNSKNVADAIRKLGISNRGTLTEYLNKLNLNYKILKSSQPETILKKLADNGYNYEAPINFNTYKNNINSSTLFSTKNLSDKESDNISNKYEI